jgi:hypothetical protein
MIFMLSAQLKRARCISEVADLGTGCPERLNLSQETAVRTLGNVGSPKS